MNTLKTWILLGALGALAVLIGRAFGPNGALIGLAIAFIGNGVAYFWGEKLALSSVRARRLEAHEEPWLHDAVDTLSRRAGIPVPPLYISPDPQPNAFAAGRGPGKSVVCFNVGLLNSMNRTEVTAVLAHELGHIKNRDILIMTVAAASASMITYLAQMSFFFGGGMRDDDEGGSPFGALLMLILAPFAATLIQLAISRTREYAADRVAAELMDSAAPMINALRRLEHDADEVPSPFAQPATAHMYIVAPLKGRSLAGLFSTHPAIADRVKKLSEFGR